MDAFIITQMLSKPAETFTSELRTTAGPPILIAVDTKADAEQKKPASKIMKMIQLVLSIGISLYAAHLSWSCSGGEHMFIRILSAVFAWLFGVVYILYFALFRSAQCKIY